MIYEVSKIYADRLGGPQEAIKAGWFNVWTEKRIKGAFNFGKGTKKDFENYMENNKSNCYFVEV